MIPGFQSYMCVDLNCVKKSFIGRGVVVWKIIPMIYRVILIPGIKAFLIRICESIILAFFFYDC